MDKIFTLTHHGSDGNCPRALLAWLCFILKSLFRNKEKDKKLNSDSKKEKEREKKRKLCFSGILLFNKYGFMWECEA